MLDFERWFQRQAPVSAEDAKEKLFDTLEKIGFEINWKEEVECQCRMCERTIILTDYISLEECLNEDPGDQYCGGSPRCCR